MAEFRVFSTHTNTPTDFDGNDWDYTIEGGVLYIVAKDGSFKQIFGPGAWTYVAEAADKLPVTEG